MDVAFHYAVKIKLLNYHSKNDVEFIEHSKEYRNENPIEARLEAFNAYQNWLDILLETIGKKYQSDTQAREDLRIFYNPKKIQDLNVDNKHIDISKSQSLGIGVYFVIDNPFKPIYKDEKINDHKGDENLIHGIGNSNEFLDPSSFAFYLDIELNYYLNYNYDHKNYLRQISYFNWMMQEVEELEFLETPFDWTGLDDPNNPKLNLVISNDIKDIIENGEGESVEFKPTLSYHFTKKTWQGKYEVNYIIAKTICAFLNSKGGLLFIGVKDNGEIQGLDYDFELSSKENKMDFFKLEFDRVLESFLGFHTKPLVNSNFVEIEGKLIYKIEVSPCKQNPVFLKANDVKEFWVRGNASTRQISDIEEIINYWLERIKL